MTHLSGIDVFSGADGTQFYTITSAFPNTGFGQDRNLTAVGDVDGDGIADLAIGTPWGNELEPLGFFDIHSGADGTYRGTHRGDRFESLASEITALGDIDGDAVADYAACTFEKGNEGGFVAVYSGLERQEIGRLIIQAPIWFWSIAGPADLDGDGSSEIAVGLWSEEDPWVAGQVRVLSGALVSDRLSRDPVLDLDSTECREATVWVVEGKTGDEVDFENEALGQGLSALGDINGDGVPDLGVGTGAMSDAIILSGADGSRLHEWTVDDLQLDQFVVETEAIGDVNGDGVPDIVVGRKGSLTLRSGKEGKKLAEMNGPGGLGEEIAAVGDLDSDGLSEILASAPDGVYAVVVSFGGADAIHYPILREKRSNVSSHSFDSCTTIRRTTLIHGRRFGRSRISEATRRTAGKTQHRRMMVFKNGKVWLRWQ